MRLKFYQFLVRFRILSSSYDRYENLSLAHDWLQSSNSYRLSTKQWTRIICVVGMVGLSIILFWMIYQDLYCQFASESVFKTA